MVQKVVVKRSDEEAARNGTALFDRDFTHAQVDAKAWPDGEVYIIDDDEHTVAVTPGVVAAIRSGRLVEVGDPEPVDVEPDGVAATDAAREHAEAAGIDLADVPPTGGSGQVTVGDVRKYAARLKGK